LWDCWWLALQGRYACQLLLLLLWVGSLLKLELLLQGNRKVPHPRCHP
jgi:hypothetical protein